MPKKTSASKHYSAWQYSNGADVWPLDTVDLGSNGLWRKLGDGTWELLPDSFNIVTGSSPVPATAASQHAETD